MSNENKILNLAFKSKEAYDELSKYLTEEDFEGHGKILYGQIADFYERDPQAEACDEDVIMSRIARRFPKHEETFRLVIKGFNDISVPNVLREVIEIKKENVAHDLSSALLSGHDKQACDLIEDYQNLVEGLVEEETEGIDTYQGESVANIVDAYKEENLIKIYPKVLNDHLGGGVPEQTHIVIFAEPELGKSLIAINMAAGFCRDGHKTLFIENEDPAKQTLMRFINRMSGMTKYDVIGNYAEAEARALSKGYGNLIFSSMSPGTIREIEGLIEEYQPKCLIVNQIRHLSFRKADGEVAQLTQAGKAMRALIKRHNLIGISIHQAADSATNKLVLERGDVYMSNTSLPGDADILIGIGANPQFKEESRRMLSLAKNKISGNHDYFPVIIDEQLSKVISI